ncbi:MAG: hypothetical protein ACXITR_10605 [Cyanobacterium sp.]
MNNQQCVKLLLNWLAGGKNLRNLVILILGLTFLSQGYQPLEVKAQSPEQEETDSDSTPTPEQPETQNIPTPTSEQTLTPSEAITQTPDPEDLNRIRILAPTEGAVLNIPSSTVVVQYPVEGNVELRVNGRLVDPTLIGRVETNRQTGLVIQTWYGVGLAMGENILSVRGTKNGQELPEVRYQLMVAEAPSKLEIETLESRVPADGRSTVTVRGQLLDKNGNRSNYNTNVTLNTSAGEFIGNDANPDAQGFQAKIVNGEFTATLRTATQAQTVRIQARTSQLEAFTQVQFDTALRSEPIINGVVDFRLGARGTDFYRPRREFLPLDEDNVTEFNVTGSAFATGSVGDWQFTGAFNSDRAINEDEFGRSRLFGGFQTSEQVYPTYGDSSTIEQTTPSIDSFYLRFERSSERLNVEPDYFMWGDFRTQEFSSASQQFTATQRSLHGFKGNYTLGNLQLSAFFANNVDGFQRDTIAPDGTRGDYFLSRRLVSPGSENIFIELEELNRPGTVLAREELRRGVDYDIDYDRGSLFFSSPIIRTAVDDQGRILVRRIVATYQFEGAEGGGGTMYGGRFRYFLSRNVGRESWLGGSFVQENQGLRDFQLYGADAFIPLGENGHLIAEYAISHNNSERMGQVSGSAYRFELEGDITERIRGRAYLQSAETGFSNNATISFVPGQTRYGAQVEATLSPTTNLRLQYDHEDNVGVAPRPLPFDELLFPGTEPVPGSRVDNSLTTITAGIQQRLGDRADLTVDWIHRSREDRISPNAFSGNSSQVRSQFSYAFTDTLRFRATNEFTVSSGTDAVFSDRTSLNLDWEVMRGITVSLGQNWFSRGGQLEGQSITSLGVSANYKVASDTNLTARYAILGGGFGSQGAVGITQGITLAPGLKVNLAYERIFQGQDLRTAAGSTFAQPFAPGQGASSLQPTGGHSYSVGIEYTDNPNFRVSAGLDHRRSGDRSNTAFSASITGKISPSLTALGTYRQSYVANQTLDLGASSQLRLGLAYRNPEDDRFNALLRYEYRKNPSLIPESILVSRGSGLEDHVFSLEGIYAPNWRWEFYGKIALRNTTTFMAEDFVGDSLITLSQLRAVYRFAYKFDLTSELRWINDNGGNYSEGGGLVELGYYLTPNMRLSAGYALGRIDDRDFSGTRSAGGPYLGLTVKLNGLFDSFGQNRPALPPQPSSVSSAPEVSMVVDEGDNNGEQITEEDNISQDFIHEDLMAKVFSDPNLTNQFSTEELMDYVNFLQGEYVFLSKEEYFKLFEVKQ